MSYNEDRIDFDEVYKQELSKVFPIFRYTQPAMIFTAVVILGSLLYPLIASIIIGASSPYGGMIIGPVVVGLIINAVIFTFLYNLYVTDNMQLFWIIFAIELVSMENVFARPASYNPEPEEYKISPMATFVDREKAKAAAEAVEEAPADDVPAPVEGRGGILFCPKCTFSLLPGETKCPRCSK